MHNTICKEFLFVFFFFWLIILRKDELSKFHTILCFLMERLPMVMASLFFAYFYTAIVLQMNWGKKEKKFSSFFISFDFTWFTNFLYFADFRSWSYSSINWFAWSTLSVKSHSSLFCWSVLFILLTVDSCQIKLITVKY